MNLDSPPPKCLHVKQLGCQLQDQDSSSTQSTGQSHNEVEGHNETSGRRVEGSTKEALCLGAPDFLFPVSQSDHGQSIVRIPYTFGDPYFGGFVAAYGPQIHTQLYGIQPARVPLPGDLAENEPMYVNAKQYHRILKRRESRAKLEAQNRLVKARKPYLHESRHLHAMKRVRGSGGRFLNTKSLQESMAAPTRNGQNATTFAPLQRGGGSHSGSEVLESETGITGTSAATSCSEVSSICNKKEDILGQAELGYPVYQSHMGGVLQNGGSILHNGSRSSSFSHAVRVTR